MASSWPITGKCLTNSRLNDTVAIVMVDNDGEECLINVDGEQRKYQVIVTHNACDDGWSGYHESYFDI